MELSALSLALTRAGLMSSFSPAALFTTGVAGAWYDPSDITTLYRDAAGTQPVTAVEQPVGLMLDKRNTAYSTYFDGAGDRLDVDNSSGLQLANTDFTIEFWVNYSTSTRYVHAVSKWNSNDLEYQIIIDTTSAAVAANISSDGTNADQAYILVSANNAISANNWRHVAWVRSSTVDTLYINGVSVATTAARPIRSGTSKVSVSGRQDAAYFGASYISNLRIVKGTALYTANFTPPTAPLTAVVGTSLLTCGTTWSGNPAITTVGNTSADKLNPFTTGTGNHAFNSSGNSANFPVLSARYNLLTKSEQFDDAVWFKGNATISANVTTAPDGTLSADALFETTTNGAHYIDVPEPGLTVSSGVTYKRSIRAKYLGRQWIAIQIYDNSAGYAWFDIQNGVVGTVQAGVTATIEPLANGWYNCTVSRTVTGTSIYVGVQTALADNSVVTFAGDTSKGIYIWGADLRVANDALNQPAYQRVNTATDYDTVGFKPYLRFNGTNQWLQTNSIDFTYGDKMFVSAGVRKLSTNSSVAFEFGPNVGVTNSTFAFYAPGEGVNKYLFWSRGTANGYGIDTTTIATPTTNVVSGLSSIAGASSFALIRTNGVQTGNGTENQGTGNYGNHPLYIGARAGTSLWFNGRLYGMVVAGKQVSAAEIENTENYLEVKTFGKDMQYVYSDPLLTAASEQITTAGGEDIYLTVTYQ